MLEVEKLKYKCSKTQMETYLQSKEKHAALILGHDLVTVTSDGKLKCVCMYVVLRKRNELNVSLIRLSDGLICILVSNFCSNLTPNLVGIAATDSLAKPL